MKYHTFSRHFPLTQAQHCEKLSYFYSLIWLVNFFLLSNTYQLWTKIKLMKTISCTCLCENCAFAKLKVSLFMESFTKYTLEMKTNFECLGFHCNWKNRKKWHFRSFSVLKLSYLTFYEFFIFMSGIIITLIKTMLEGLVCLFVKYLLLYRAYWELSNSGN